MIIKSPIQGLLASILLVSGTAMADVINFEDFGTTTFDHGDVVSNQYSIVDISADNATNSVDLAVVFDSLLSGTADPDLEGDFYDNPTDKANMVNGFNPGNILIIQENACPSTGCVADDEGARPAGSISFVFKVAIELLSIDFFDIETPENGTGPNNRIDVWDFDTNVVTTVGHTPDTGGDNLWKQLLFDSTVHPELLNVGRVDIYLGGSGAIDNLTYNVVPVPAAFWLFGTALVGFIGFSRRTTI